MVLFCLSDYFNMIIHYKCVLGSQMLYSLIMESSLFCKHLFMFERLFIECVTELVQLLLSHFILVSN